MLGRDARIDREPRDTLEHHSICTNNSAIANQNIAQHFRARGDIDVMANNRSASFRTANCDIRSNIATLPYYRAAMNYDTNPAIGEDCILADFSSEGYFAIVNNFNEALNYICTLEISLQIGLPCLLEHQECFWDILIVVDNTRKKIDQGLNGTIAIHAGINK